MKTELKGSVMAWEHSPEKGCSVTIAVAGAHFKLNATPELVAACHERSEVRVTIEVDPPKATTCPCCGPLKLFRDR